MDCSCICSHVKGLAAMYVMISNQRYNVHLKCVLLYQAFGTGCEHSPC